MPRSARSATSTSTSTIAGDVPVRVALGVAAILGVLAGGWRDNLMAVELWLVAGAATWSLAFEPQRPERMAGRAKLALIPLGSLAFAWSLAAGASGTDALARLLAWNAGVVLVARDKRGHDVAV